MSFKRDSKSFKRGSKSFKRDSKSFKRGSKSFKRGSKSFKRGSKAFKRGSKAFKRVSMQTQFYRTYYVFVTILKILIRIVFKKDCLRYRVILYFQINVILYCQMTSSDIIYVPE